MADDTAPVSSTALLPRTAQGLITFYNTMLSDRGITVPPHLVAPCRALMDDRINNLMLVLGPGAGKSQLLSVAYPAFEIGLDPSMTVLNISAGEALVQGFQKAVMDWIEHSPCWATLFPNVRPDKEVGWSTERGMFVTGHKRGDPDASYFAAGLTSSALTGKHARRLILDDLHNKENGATSEQCEKVRQSYYNTIIGRQDPQGARIICAGRRWHTDDIYGHLRESGDWVVMELAAIRENTEDLYWDVTLPGDGFVCCFNEDQEGIRIA